MKEKKVEYNGYMIHAIQTTYWVINKIEKDENGEPKEKFVLTDTRTIDGDNLQSIDQAINDAKKNIDTFKRLKIE